MHPILTIARFELAKKKVALKPTAIIGLLVVFVLFSGAFYLLSHDGYKPNHSYFLITPTGGALDSYVAASQIFHLSTGGPVHAYLRPDGSYVLDADSQFQGLAATTALLASIQSQNRQIFASSKLHPPFLVLLNITTVHREEILTSPESAASQIALPQAGAEITKSNSQIILRDSTTTASLGQSLANVGASSGAIIPIPPGGTELATQQYTRPLTSISPGDDLVNGTMRNLRLGTNFSDASATAISSSSIPNGLTYPNDVNTLVGVKYLFLIIQLMLVFNFFSALLGNSFFEEKLNYRSSILFSMPLPKRFVIIGKLLPYLCLSFAIALILIGVQQPSLLLQPLLYLLLFVLALTYFSLSFLNGLLARSNKEYSFLNVF